MSLFCGGFDKVSFVTTSLDEKSSRKLAKFFFFGREQGTLYLILFVYLFASINLIFTVEKHNSESLEGMISEVLEAPQGCSR